MGGGGGLGLFVGTVGSRATSAFAEGKLIAAILGNTATDAGGGGALATQAPTQQWGKKRSIEYLQRNTKEKPGNRCAEAVSQAIEAGGIRLNRDLNLTRTKTNPSGSASGYAPVLKAAGFRAMPTGTTPQPNDVVVFPQSRGHKHGHIAMFDGRDWRSDFKQIDIYGSPKRREDRTPYTLYRRP